MVIENFERVRLDGNIITETTTSEEILRRFGGPEKVNELRWKHDSEFIHLKFPQTIDGARIARGRKYLAILLPLGEFEWPRCSLRVYNSNGTARFEVPSRRIVQGREYEGSFLAMSKPRVDAPNAFSAVYAPGGTGYSVQIDIDAENGDVFGEYWIK